LFGLKLLLLSLNQFSRSRGEGVGAVVGIHLEAKEKKKVTTGKTKSRIKCSLITIKKVSISYRFGTDICMEPTLSKGSKKD